MYRIFQYILILTAMAAVLEAPAQEPLMPEVPEAPEVRNLYPGQAPEQDSTVHRTGPGSTREIMYMNLLSGLSPAGELNAIPELPDLNLDAALVRRYQTGYALFLPDLHTLNGFLPGNGGFYPAPLFRNGQIFSEGSIPLGEKFMLGGQSFGANSIMTAPFPNQGFNNFDTRGSSLFLQYNVSDKVKIQTRVSVSQGPGPF